MSVPCIHRRLVDECPICMGYRSFVAERFVDRKNTPAARRLFWQYGGQVVAAEAMRLRDRRIAEGPSSPNPA